jgi:hypothetical protein
MGKKEELLEIFKKSTMDTFVNEFDKIDNARITINNYMKEISFNYEYDYNTFCKEFASTVEKILNMIDENRIMSIDINFIIYESLILMVRNKIFEMTPDEKTKTSLLILHELKNFLMAKENKK